MFACDSGTGSRFHSSLKPPIAYAESKIMSIGSLLSICRLIPDRRIQLKLEYYAEIEPSFLQVVG